MPGIILNTEDAKVKRYNYLINRYMHTLLKYSTDIFVMEGLCENVSF